MEGWHDFFLMSGTAAATLVGLLFVAVTLHVQAIVRPETRGAHDFARATFLDFLTLRAYDYIE